MCVEGFAVCGGGHGDDDDDGRISELTGREVCHAYHMHAFSRACMLVTD